MNESNQSIKFTHALRIAGYSWPLYATGSLGIVIAVNILTLASSPFLLRCILAAGIAVTLVNRVGLEQLTKQES